MYNDARSQILYARRFENDRTPNDPSACVERLGKDAPASCNAATLSGLQRIEGTDKTTLNTLQLIQSSMRLLLVVDSSVVEFWLNPRILLVEVEYHFLVLYNASLQSQHFSYPRVR